MSLADAIQAEQAKTMPGPFCTMCKTLRSDQLSKQDKADLQAALADEDIASSAIARALASEGFRIRAHTITRHRKGLCAGGTQ